MSDEEKLKGLVKLLLGLNAYGSLSLEDLKLIEAYIKGSFNYEYEEESK